MAQPSFRNVATATLKAAALLTAPGIETRLRATEEWASVVFPGRPENDIPTRDLQRQIDSVVDRATQFLEHISVREEYRDVRPEDMNVVLATIRETLQASVDYFKVAELTRQTITPSGAVSVLAPQLLHRWQQAVLSQDAQEFGRTILEVCCYELVSWAQLLPVAQNAAGWATLTNTWILVNSTREILQELRRTGLAQAREPYRIALSQRRDIASMLGKMELFGLPVEPRYRRIPISVSYVMAHGTGVSRGKVRVLSFEEVVAGAAYHADNNAGLRLLVKGRAGSGKTTAVQWLAHQSATHQLGRLNGSLGSTVPFFVRLRSALEDQSSIPPDSALLMSGQLRDGIGPDWIENMCEAHRPLIIFDGWDELKPARRTIASGWLSTLCQRFPSGHVIVTSRPEGASDEVFQELDFNETTLALLGQEQKGDLISRWFKGLRKNLQQSPDLDESKLMEAESSLLRDVRGPVLYELTDTPLITAMLCCLYATSTSRNPLNKSALYQKVATTLIHARDEDRGVHAGPWDELLIGQKEDLLGEIALKMMETGSLQLPKISSVPGEPSIDELTRKLLTKFGKSPSTSDAIIEAMLDRSIILQEVGDSEGEFVHKTFQEYLSGTLLARRWDSSKLFELVNRDDRFISVLPFAIHSAEQEIADSIIKWLLDRESSTSENTRRETLFVILECLSAAKGLDPAVREGGMEVAEGVVPPKNSEEARAIAFLRDAVVDLLRVEKWEPVDDEYCIEALARIGTGSAVDALSGYAKVRGDTAKQFLVQAWDRIRESNYAEAVLNRVSTGLQLSARNPERLREIAGIHSASRVECSGVDLSDGLLQVLSDLPELRALTLTECRGLEDLSDLASLTSLRSITLKGLEDLGDIGSIGHGLLQLEIERLSTFDISWSSILSRSPELEVLRVRGVRIRRPVSSRFLGSIPGSSIAGCKSLRALEFEYDFLGRSSDLEFLSNLGALRVLRLSCPVTSAGVAVINSLRRLRTLKITCSNDAGSDRAFLDLPNLVHLEVANGGPWMPASLATSRRLTTLRLANCRVGSIETMPLAKSLKQLELDGCTLEGPESAAINKADRIGVRELRCSGESLTDLDFIARFPLLERLEISKANALRDLSGVLEAPDGCQIDISGVSGEVDDSPIDELRSSGRCFVNFEPTMVWHEQYDSGES
jgi:NACHT domain